MDNSEEQRGITEHEVDDIDRSNGEDFSDLSSAVTSSSCGGEVGITERLMEVLHLEDGDGDDRVVQWLMALDFQVMGACRADDRLKPLLKLNVSTGAAEDRLLAHLSQHFEASEVAMLARCLCFPIVSIRVGKITKQGTRLCPTATRGNLNLMLLTTSNLRISFVGDDGHTERLFTLSSDLQCSDVSIEEISADKSGQSFLIKIPNGQIYYFWFAEKSKLLGIELIEKMKDFLEKKPSLSELSGINESRLNCFAIHLKAYLVGPSVTNTHTKYSGPTIPFPSVSSNSPEIGHNAQSSFTLSKPSLYEGSTSLSPRSSSFKEGLTRKLNSLRSVEREKFRQLGDDNRLSCIDHLSITTPITSELSSSNLSEPSFLESLGKSTDLPFLSRASQLPSMGSSLLSPYYCWCPVASSLQHTTAPPELPSSLTESISLPPLASLLSNPRPSTLLTQKATLNLDELPSLIFPPILPEPLVRFPLLSSPRQIPTFTPLTCDPIVHIPFIEVCSSGHGYLVSAGPAITTNIPPLHSKLVNPLIPETDSVKGARETLRLLIGSSTQNKSTLMDVLPSVLNHIDEKQSVIAGGSRGLYTGAMDVTAIANGGVIKGCFSKGQLVDPLERLGGGLGGTSSSEDDIVGEEGVD